MLLKGLLLIHVVILFFSRQGNIKSMSRNSSKTSIKLTLAFYNLPHVEQRSQRVNPTPHRGSFLFFKCFFPNASTCAELDFPGFVTDPTVPTVKMGGRRCQDTTNWPTDSQRTASLLRC